MTFRVYDSFNRNPSASPLVELGFSDSGDRWIVYGSDPLSVSISGNRARLSLTATTVLAVLDSDGSDGTLTASIYGTGAGLGIYGRLIDSANWWRAYQRIYTYTYQSGTETYISGYKEVKTGTETYISGYTPVEYLWTATYLTGVTHDYQDLYGKHTVNRWASSSTSNPFNVNGEISHAHFLAADFYPGDDSIHFHQYSSGYYTGQRRGGDPIYSTRDVYESQPIYSTRPVYSTATGYELKLQKSVAGTLTTVQTKQLSGPFTSLALVMKGNRIDAYASGGSVGATDTTHATASRHGIGLVKDSEFLSTDNMFDDFHFGSAVTGRVQPPVLL